MKKKEKIKLIMKPSYLILIFLIIIAGLTAALIFVECQHKKLLSKIQQTELTQQQKEENVTQPLNSTSTPQEEKYPNHLLEGEIIEIKPEVITINAKISKIFPEAGMMKKNIKITPETEFEKYSFETKEKSPMEFEELRVGDFVLARVKESTYDEVLSRDIFTASRVIQMK
ncbi:MAG: hypothetical protein DRH33_00010 [Candidatus Nealsonbacteria bacterium]|nr:MAG: hypothetical protein DRH33_00010 [Candidatus Nealsonbacteria bacterium]